MRNKIRISFTFMNSNNKIKFDQLVTKLFGESEIKFIVDVINQFTIGIVSVFFGNSKKIK
jgi:hypothetical protein